MKTKNLAVAAFLTFIFPFSFFSSAFAQRPSIEEFQARRAEMVQRQADRLAKEFELKDGIRDSFISLYRAYQNDLLTLMQQDRQRFNRDGERGDDSRKKELTNEEAARQIEEYFSRQETQIARQLQRLAMDKEYYDKFKAMLTPQQLANIFTQRNRQRQGGGQQRGFNGSQGGQGRGPRGGDFNGGFNGGSESGFNDGF